MKGKSKNILIASQRGDRSTDDVIEWLGYFGQTVERINDVVLDNPYFNMEIGSKLKSIKKKGIWFRRPDTFGTIGEIEKNHFKSNTSEDINYYANQLAHEMQEGLASAKEAFWAQFKSENMLGSFTGNVPDKMRQLRLAQEVGLDIPKSIISSNRDAVIEFHSNCEKGIITKSLSDSAMIEIKDVVHSVYTEEILLEELNALKPRFFPALFQEKLEKAYEIRTFYMHEKFYSMAIFSQRDQQTAVDFRKYNKVTPNRNAAYQLPKVIEEKTIRLMKKLKLNCGSLDFVKTKDGRTVYLEVNPVGQFGMVSGPCNYKLERKIAEELIQ